jgi:hypothetical protein
VFARSGLTPIAVLLVLAVAACGGGPAEGTPFTVDEVQRAFAAEGLTLARTGPREGKILAILVAATRPLRASIAITVFRREVHPLVSRITQAQIDAFARSVAIDKPIYERYGTWRFRFVQDDDPDSFLTPTAPTAIVGNLWITYNPQSRLAAKIEAAIRALRRDLTQQRAGASRASLGLPAAAG